MTEMRVIPAIDAGAASASLPAPFEARHWIGGTWQDSADGAVIERHSPAHGHLVSRAAKGGQAEADAAIAAARHAFDHGPWPRLAGKDRAALLLRVAELIERDLEELALFEVLESGKPISQARDEVAGAADLWRYAGALARTQAGESHNNLGPDMLGMVLKAPVGVVSLITPWNFPLLIVSQKLPFALAAGCCAVIKPSELTPSTTVKLGALLSEAGLPDGTVNIVLGEGRPVGEALAADPRVDMVSFTGSTAVGRGIAAAAAGTLKKVSLELGGKNAQVVLADADLDAAADAIVFGIYFNAGECCNSGSRVIVQRAVAEALTDKIVALSRKVAFGDPLDPATQVGALIHDAHFSKVDGYVAEARASGARIALGGGRLDVPGLERAHFYQPTVVTDISADMPIARDEVFGPVLAMLVVDSLDEAISTVNDRHYGLSAGIWSDDVHSCLEFARRAHAGTVWTNTWMDGFAEMPFGGVGQSGLGRELGRYGLEEFLEAKTVTMRLGRSRAPWVKDGPAG